MNQSRDICLEVVILAAQKFGHADGADGIDEPEIPLENSNRFVNIGTIAKVANSLPDPCDAIWTIS